MVDGGQGGRDDARAVARAMAELAPLTAPDPAERERIRHRVLAGLEPPSPRPRPATTGRAGRASRRRPGTASRGLSGTRRRFVVAAVAVLALLGSLAGMSLLMARNALPGDALYGVKRSAEEASLGLTFNDESRATKHLEFATARIDEMAVLAGRYPNPADAPVGGYLTALTDFDTDAAAGSRQLIALGTSTDGRALRTLRDWAGDQHDRLTAFAPRLPGSARIRLADSDELLTRITARASELSARMRCYQITSGERDDIGARAATSPCEQAAGPPLSGTAVPPAGDDEPVPGSPSEPYPPGGMVEPSGTAEPAVAPTRPAPTPPATPRVPVQPAGVRPHQPADNPPPAEQNTLTVAVALPPMEIRPLGPGLPAIDIGA